MSRLSAWSDHFNAAKATVGTVGGVILVVAYIATPVSVAQVVTDDFSDGNDTANPAWTRLDGLVGSTGQTWEVTNGEYRLYAPSNGIENIGFVGSHVGPSYTDVRVTMDLVEFYTLFVPPNGPEFVNIMARSNGANEILGLTGYAYGYDPIANANAGEMVLYRNDAGDPVNDMGAQRVTLDQDKDYQFMLEVIGNTMHGRVTDIETGEIVAESFADISDEPNVYESGTSGVFGYTESPFETRFAIDNFRTEEALAGDYNRNGAVDAADSVVWRETLGNQSPELDPVTFQVISLSDMGANGAVSGNCGFNTPNCEMIDEADYDVWMINFGRAVSAGGMGFGNAAPEPAGAMLLLSAAVGGWLGRRTRQ